MAIVWQPTEQGLRPILQEDPERSIAWAPQPGSQTAFLQCPIMECLYEGERGPGKTDALLMDFAQHVGHGYKGQWRGILFRRTYPELQDVVDKSQRWFADIFPKAKYNRAEHFWLFPDGEQLFMRHFDTENDYWSYHGHEYPWQGWEEITTWPDPGGLKRMLSCARSTYKGIPIKIRATTNPYGVGHNWVKARYELPIPPGQIIGPIVKSIDENGDPEHDRVAVHGCLTENKVLLHADPHYMQRLRSAARNEAELKAWLHGDWNIVAGGMLDDVWEPRVHQVPNLPPHLIPARWRIDRSYDHGQSAPFSVGWWAESNGEPFRLNQRDYGQIPGDLFRIGEWYGWNGRPNEGIRLLATEIAQGIKEREKDWGIQSRVRAGNADASIFDDYEPGRSVEGDMRKMGVRWEKADKGPGSRIQGWQQLRTLLKQAKANPREKPGLYIMERCKHFMRTVPTLPRSNKNLDDVDTEAEDHVGDETRYRLRRKQKAAIGRNY